MIVVQMMGNLGNQLFIYAMARSLQLERGDEIAFDFRGLKRFYYSSDYKLIHLNINRKGIIDYSMIPTRLKAYYRLTSKIYHIEQRICRILRKDSLIPDCVTKRWFSRGCYYSFSRSFFDFPNNPSKNIFVYGYFQNKKYFNKFSDVIKNECKVVDELDEYDQKMLPQIQSEDSVAVSIRAINELGVSFINFEYYYDAMKEMKKRIENPRFYVFSDDIQEVKEKMDFPFPVEYVTPADACHGLRLLYNCKHFIIANSTFSWWGAYLCNNRNKVIIMPEKIDKEGVGREDYFLDGCIRLPCSFVEYRIDSNQIIHKKYAK